MKRIVGAAIAAMILGVFGAARAQTENEIALTRKMIQTERQAIVAENLGLSEEQAKVFWPLYRDYTGARAGLGDRMKDLILKYGASYKTMDDATATKLLDDYLDIQKDELALKREWVGKMRKVFPGTLVTRYFQIENKLDAFTRAVASDEIPLVTGGKPVTIAP